MQIPCGEDFHWRYIYALLPFWSDQLEVEGFREAIGDYTRGSSWLLSDQTNPECYSYATLSPPSAEIAKDVDAPSHFLSIETYRETRTAQTSGIEHGRFFDTLEEYSKLESLRAFSTVDLVFPSKLAKWNTQLLANPPEFRELGEQLGSISLRGVTLRFSESKAGLHEAVLEINQDETEFLVRLRFVLLIPLSDARNFFGALNRKAEEFAELFVDIG